MGLDRAGVGSPIQHLCGCGMSGSGGEQRITCATPTHLQLGTSELNRLHEKMFPSLKMALNWGQYSQLRDVVFPHWARVGSEGPLAGFRGDMLF